MLESTRAKEEAVKKETAEQLDLFRRQQEEADKALLNEGGDTTEPSPLGNVGSPPAAESNWTVNASKRKRAKDKEGLKGVKLRKSSSTSETSPAIASSDNRADDSTTYPTPKDSKTESSSPIENDTISVKAASTPKSNAILSGESSTNKAENIHAGKAALPALGLAGYSSDED